MFLLSNINSIESQIDWPTSKNVAEQVQKLDYDDFLILTREVDGEYYIQTMKDEHAGFVLEFREGSADSHYSLSDEFVEQSQVKDAFDAYLNDHFEDWKVAQNFEPVGL